MPDRPSSRIGPLNRREAFAERSIALLERILHPMLAHGLAKCACHRRVVATRAPSDLLSLLARDQSWEVRWEVAQRADRLLAERLARDAELDVRMAAQSRLAELTAEADREPER